MFPGPVFFHELRTVARRRRSFALRLGFGLFLLYLVVSYARPYTYQYRIDPVETEGYSPGELAAVGMRLFGTVAWLQALAVLVLTPALVAGAIGEDRERKVLSYLLASPLTAGEIVLGKLAARLIHLATLVAVGLPIVSLALFLGGVEPAQVWLVFVGTMAVLYFLAAISIFVSTFSKRPREAILMAYLYEAFWLFLPAIERGIIQEGGIVGQWVEAARPVTEYLTGSSPMVLMFGNWFQRGSRVVEDIAWMIGLQVIYGTILLAWATLRLRAVEQGARLFGLRWMGSDLVRESRPLRARRACGDDPMLWKECPEALATGGRVKAAAQVLGLLAFVAGLVYWFVQAGIPAIREMSAYGYGATSPYNAREDFNTGVRVFTMSLYPLTALFLAVTAATGFTSEKEKDTWISLIATPLEGREIVRAKLLGAFWRARFLVGAQLVVWLIGLACGALHPLALAFCVVATFIYLFWFATLGTLISIRAKSSARAIAATLGIAMFCNVGYLFCCIPMMTGGPGSIIVAAGISPMIVTGAACTFSEFEDFVNGRIPSISSELAVLGLFSLGFYGGVGARLLFDCYSQFQLTVDRPHKGWWPRPEASARGIRFLDGDPIDGEGIAFEDDDAQAPDPGGPLDDPGA